MENYINPFSQNTYKIAKQFDDAMEQHDIPTIENLIDSAKKFLDNSSTSNGLPQENDASKSYICYSIATSYGDISSLIGKTHDEELIKQQLFYYRESIRYIEIEEYEKEEYTPYVCGFKLNLYTNYGNTLKLCGRFISAIDQYMKVLKVNPKFGMALGNIGVLYQYYGYLVYDSLHRDYLHYFAYHYLSSAINSNDPNIYDQARKGFEKHIKYYNIEYINDILIPDLKIPNKEFESTEEYFYRQWGLENYLFLNPLVDLPISENFFAIDEINLPNMIVEIGSKPIFHGMFNQIKQEYVYARYLYYSSLRTSNQPHFADIDTQLINLPDFPQYSIRIEKVKASFKTLFGLFDKIGYFLNSYFELGMNLRNVNFHRIWDIKDNNNNPKLNISNNIALSSLYWINKDVSNNSKKSPNPYLERIAQVRNNLEHKYVKVINDIWNNDYKDGRYDDLVLYVTEREMYDITLDLLKILRESIICLSLCVNIEENKKRDNLSPNTIICPIDFTEFEDSWKT